MLALAEKNNLKNESWYLNLRNLIVNDHDFENRIKKKSRLLWLLRSIFQWCVVCTIPKKPTSDCEIIFHSIQYNLNCGQGECFDRLYLKSPINGGKKILFLLKLSPSFEGIKIYKDWYDKCKALESIQYHPIIYLDHYLRLSDIFKVSIVSFWFQLKLSFYLHALRKKKIFYIGGKDASKILIPLLDNSFHGDLQDAMLYAKSFERFLSSVAPNKKIITYGELLPGFRAIYYSGHKLDMEHQFIAIQHALAGKNKLSSYFSASEFSDDISRQGGMYSPMPDLYLVQGQQFSEVLGTYYPKNRIRIIGCLKYDQQKKEPSNSKDFLIESRKKEPKILVIAPSIGDFKEIKTVLSSDIDFTGWKIILSPHPVYRVETIKYFRSIGYLDSILTIENSISTAELVKDADIVLTGFSVLALEALFGNALPIRAINPNLPPQIDLDEGIPVITKPSELSSILKNFDQIKIDRNEIIAKYFYRLDGMAWQRMWSEINASIS